MTRVMRRIRLRQVMVGGAIWLCVGDRHNADAQSGVPAGQPAESTVATDPIRCWRRTGKSAVYVGERFSLTLTCSVVDTPALRVVAEETKLDPAALQLPPFDVLDGIRHADIEAGQRRLFQYEYSLRVIAEDLFGREVAIPALDVTYRVQNQAAGADTVESLDQTYRLPALPVRVMTLVSPQVVDIRDASTQTFDAIQDRRFRGNVAYALAALLFSATIGSLALAATAVARRYRTSPERTPPLLPDTSVLRSAIHELERVLEEARRDNWNRDVVGKALAAVRVGIAIALGRRPSQTILDPGAPAREGAVTIRSGIIRPRHVMVSAAVTSDTLSDVPGGSTDSGTLKAASPALDDFRPILAILTAARYRREDNLPSEQLDEAVRDAIGLLRRLCRERSWPNSGWQAIRRTVAARQRRVP
jgi:hypothetical protein